MVITNTGASIVVQNTMEKPSSFMTYGALSAPISYQWVYPTGKYIYLGHCVDGNTFTVIITRQPTHWFIK
jgi:hypothetical protein